MRKLATILTTPIYRGFLAMYQEAKNTAIATKDLSKTLTNFQGLIRLIPQWTPEKRSEIVKEIRDNTRECNFIDELLAAVFIAEIRIMTAAKIAETPRKINLIIPSFEKFIHNAYVQCARAIWKAAFLFLDVGVQPIEQQRNLLKIEEIIREQLQETVDKMVPTRDILRSFLSETLEPQGGVLPSGEDDITKDIGKAEEEQIRQLVKKEIDTFKTITSATSGTSSPQPPSHTPTPNIISAEQTEQKQEIISTQPLAGLEDEEEPLTKGKFASAKVDRVFGNSEITGGAAGGDYQTTGGGTSAPLDDIFDDIRSISQFGITASGPGLEKLEVLKTVPTIVETEEIERLDAATPVPPAVEPEDEIQQLPEPVEPIDMFIPQTKSSTWGSIETSDAPIQIVGGGQPIFDGIGFDDMEIIE